MPDEPVMERRGEVLRELRPVLADLAEDLGDTPRERIDALLRARLREIPSCELIYVLDAKGCQVSSNVGRRLTGIYQDAGQKRASRSKRTYFADALQAGVCTLTGPYRSRATGNRVVTITHPLPAGGSVPGGVLAADIPERDLLFLVTHGGSPPPLLAFGRRIYMGATLFLTFIGLALMGHAAKGMWGLLTSVGGRFQPEVLFKATILTTLALAVFDLAKTVYEEEVVCARHPGSLQFRRKPLARFMASVIIALAIEALMLVFKFTLHDPTQLPLAVALIGGVAALLLSLGAFLYLTGRSGMVAAEIAVPHVPSRSADGKSGPLYPDAGSAAPPGRARKIPDPPLPRRQGMEPGPFRNENNEFG